HPLASRRPSHGAAPDRLDAQGPHAPQYRPVRARGAAARPRHVARLQGPLVAGGGRGRERSVTPESRTVAIRDGAASFRVLSAGHGPHLVYFHSFYEGGGWSPFLERLAARHTVLAPLHPGVEGSAGIETL